MEANPSSVEATRIPRLQGAGVNRVSRRRPALNDRDLKFLGRLHDVENALKAVRLAREIFPRMSFDLIYARPNQTVEEWERELKEAVSIRRRSSVALPAYHRGRDALLRPAQGRQARRSGWRAVGCSLRGHAGDHAAIGMPAYEVSNHARPGRESRHNLTYWRYGDYAGIGPGAHGRLAIGSGKIAYRNRAQPRGMAATRRRMRRSLIERELLDFEAQADELLLMGLRAARRRRSRRWQTLSGPRSGSGPGRVP